MMMATKRTAMDIDDDNDDNNEGDDARLMTSRQQLRLRIGDSDDTASREAVAR